MGLHRAGFDVTGIDIKNQPRYPFRFVQADATNPPFDLREFDFIWASPPCQAHSTLRALHPALEYACFIAATRAILKASGKPYVIENVVGAPLIDPVMLCGSSFCLNVRRHRLFESSIPMLLLPVCRHDLQPFPIDVSGTGGRQNKPRSKPNGGRGRKPINLAEARAAIGIDWMVRTEISQAIPPAYSEFIGRQVYATRA